MVATVCAIVLIPNVTATASFLVEEDTTYLGKHPWVVKPSRGIRRARLSERTPFFRDVKEDQGFQPWELQVQSPTLS
jgi:hypothetical protein